MDNGGKKQDTLEEQIKLLQTENAKLHADFNSQRAKLKELFLQKENEYEKCLRDQKKLQQEFCELKSQFLVVELKSKNEIDEKESKAQEEISSLQQIVQDTIEESSSCKQQLERIKKQYDQLVQENHSLREKFRQDNSSTPQVLTQMKKKIVKKMVGEPSRIAVVPSQDTSEDYQSQCVYEDAEVLHCLVEQLQEEMEALKGKLREADEKLQDVRTSKSLNTSGLQELNQCKSCQTYNLKLHEAVLSTEEYKEKITVMGKLVQKLQEDLEKEAALRKDLENQWQKKRDDHKVELQVLRENLKLNELSLRELQQKFLDTKENVIKELRRLTEERKCVNKHFEMLQADNDFLSGRYLKSAEEIENQSINLPNNVPALHELILKQQQELIQARICSEYEKQKCVSSLDEVQILRQQLEVSNNDCDAMRHESESKLKLLQDRISAILVDLKDYESTKLVYQRKEAELNRHISELRTEIIQLRETIEKLNKTNSDYKSKIKNLQEELLTSEQVQKDFVKLSQNLQMSLEQLRQADTEVRWQNEEDIDNCPSCKTYFTVTVRKIHCKHCGHIYCDKCLSKTVVSGPRKRLARVCDMCHTLLTPNTAPYFSIDARSPEK